LKKNQRNLIDYKSYFVVQIERHVFVTVSTGSECIQYFTMGNKMAGELLNSTENDSFRIHHGTPSAGKNP
jgi:hypothetical protein